MPVNEKTHAEIIAESYHNTAATQYVRKLLDRLEAAHKREVEKLNSVIQATVSHSDAEIDRLRREVAELRKQIGNAAKMRKTLKEIRDMAVAGVYDGTCDCHEITRVAEVALGERKEES